MYVLVMVTKHFCLPDFPSHLSLFLPSPFTLSPPQPFPSLPPSPSLPLSHPRSLPLHPLSPSTLLLLEQSSTANECLGMDYLLQAAERGMKLAMLEVAKAYDTGLGLGKVPEGDSSFPVKQR